MRVAALAIFVASGPPEVYLTLLSKRSASGNFSGGGQGFRGRHRMKLLGISHVDCVTAER